MKTSASAHSVAAARSDREGEQGGDIRKTVRCWQVHWLPELNRYLCAGAAHGGRKPHNQSFELHAGTRVGRIGTLHGEVRC